MQKVHFGDSRAYLEIYRQGSKFIKDKDCYGTFHEDETSFCFIDPEEAKARRDIMSPLFSRKAVSKLQGVIRRKVCYRLM
jgi:cytochrome P450